MTRIKIAVFPLRTDWYSFDQLVAKCQRKCLHVVDLNTCMYSPGTAKPLNKLDLCDYFRCRISSSKESIEMVWRLEIARRTRRPFVWQVKLSCGYFVNIAVKCSFLSGLAQAQILFTNSSRKKRNSFWNEIPFIADYLHITGFHVVFVLKYNPTIIQTPTFFQNFSGWTDRRFSAEILL